jgi:predicted Zn-dependent peptidase
MMPDSVQSSITLCMVKDGYNAPERRSFSFLSTITGGYFGSRLMQNLRERNGYTYGITAGSVYFGNQALFIINSDVNAEHTQAAIDACFEELKRLQEEPVGTEELESARNYLLGNMLRDVDNSVSYLKRYAFWHSFGLDETEFQQQIQAIRNTHADTLQQLAKKHFNYNNFTRIIVGNTTQLTPEF